METIECEICGAKFKVNITENKIQGFGSPKFDKNSNAFTLVETKKKIEKLQSDLIRSQKTNTKLLAENKKLKGGSTHEPERHTVKNDTREPGDQHRENRKCRWPWEWFGD